ncbi:putative oxidoreductase [Tranquillimonas rosea]|uniref:Putative oxidoreductase n=1 Tax=Tranquillimonas rosea TaxID=641238 RepID=A0A1H9V6U6_9RHOB|nr:DoxX family protein [Tranquillimonas rosea]SES17402.1 putative oxidoreductase [Tranquillimonas rosea]
MARDLCGFVGRLLLALLFLAGAAQKARDPAPVMALLDGAGWPEGLVWPALAFNAAAGLMLIAGLWLTPLALTLAAYCAVTSWFHFQPDDPWQISIFVKNWAITGGLLCLAANGGGRWRLGPR